MTLQRQAGASQSSYSTDVSSSHPRGLEQVLCGKEIDRNQWLDKGDKVFCMNRFIMSNG